MPVNVYQHKHQCTFIRDSTPGLRISHNQPKQLSVPSDISRSLKFPNVLSIERDAGWTLVGKVRKKIVRK